MGFIIMQKILMETSTDSTLTISNDIHEVYNIFGIEAARKVLFEEIKTVIEHSGIYINSRHLRLLVDTMTSRGYIMSIDRHGINRSDAGPLIKSSFEETTDQLAKAGIFSQIDHMSSITSTVMTGQKGVFGTNMCKLLVDPSIINKKLVTIYNLPVSNNINVIVVENTSANYPGMVLLNIPPKMSWSVKSAKTQISVRLGLSSLEKSPII